MIIKIFLQLVAIHGVICAPGIPFLEYGLPESEIKKSESFVPESVNIERTQLDLPGTRNLDEKRIPDSVTKNLNDNKFIENLPGTRNLDEKSIPDSITLKKIPVIRENLELPRYAYNGGFIEPEKAVVYYPYANPEEEEIKKIEEKELPKEDENQSGYKLYPNETPLEEIEGSEIRETGIFPISNSPESPPVLVNSGESIQDTFIQPIPNTENKNQINIQPGTSIKLQDNLGQYSHGFSNPDGTQVQESGHLISTDNGWEYVIAKEGSYQYISPEGYPISVRYIADENGFRILSQNFAGR